MMKTIKLTVPNNVATRANIWLMRMMRWGLIKKMEYQ